MISELLNAISAYLDYIAHNKVRKKEKSEALSAMKDALRLTKRHINSTRTSIGDIASRNLTEKWSAVARIIRPHDKRIAMLFEMKSDYWIDPIMFKYELKTNKRKFDFRFRIKEIEKIINQIESEF